MCSESVRLCPMTAYGRITCGTVTMFTSTSELSAYSHIIAQLREIEPHPESSPLSQKVQRRGPSVENSAAMENTPQFYHSIAGCDVICCGNI